LPVNDDPPENEPPPLNDDPPENEPPPLDRPLMDDEPVLLPEEPLCALTNPVQVKRAKPTVPYPKIHPGGRFHRFRMTHPFHIRGDGPLPPLLAFRELSLTSLHFARRSFRSCQLFLSHQNEQPFTCHRLIGARYSATRPCGSGVASSPPLTPVRVIDCNSYF